MFCRCRVKRLALHLTLIRHMFRTQLIPFSRSVSTHSACLLPRGHARYERDTRILQEEEDVVAPATAAPSVADTRATATEAPSKDTHTTNNHNHRDTRPIDSVDPVIVKYVNMLNDIRNSGKAAENVNVTYFGNVRFDSENVPRVHGQFDSDFEIDKAEYLRDSVPGFQGQSKEANSVNILTLSETGERESDDMYFLNYFDGKASGVKEANYLIHRVMGLQGQSKEMNDVNFYNEEGGQENDSMYFLNDSDEKASQMKEMNYIDEQVFHESYNRYQNLNSQSIPRRELVDKAPHATGQERQKLEEGDPIRHHDLNYIDEVFFKSSLEDLVENRKQSVEYSVIKEELESTLLNARNQYGDNDEALKLSDPPVDLRTTRTSFSELEQEASPKDVKVAKEDKKSVDKEAPPKSAYDFIVKKRREEHQQTHGIMMPAGQSDPGKKSYSKILSLLNLNRKDEVSKYEMLKVLKNSIIFDQYDIVGLYKPYGLSMHPGTESPYHALSDFLPDLAAFLKTEELYAVHRLDSTTTGVMLLARTPAMAGTLKMMFKNRELKKTYWAIVKGTPNPTHGIIDIPIAEGLIGNRRRMVLKPDIPGVRSTNSRSQYAVTSYKVLSSSSGVSMVELLPKTGLKHQLRVHLGFGLSCPVLGDHKYSHFRKLAPQRLPGDTLQRLKLKQSRVRDLPMFLHSRSIVVPEVNEGRNVVVTARLPAYFNKALSLLHLNRKGNQVLMKELADLA